MRGPRVHRLPQRLDWTLIPAPLDLSLPLVAEKSPLPAIIVTPSSPSSTHDFAIAFLAPDKSEKPSIRQRLAAFAKLPTPFPLKARFVFFLFLFVFIIICHVVTHRLAERRPYLEFSIQGGDKPAIGSIESLLDLTGLWSAKGDEKREFVI